MMQTSVLSAALAVWAYAYGAHGEPTPEVKNIAIIGAGAAGSSTAYHLQQYASEENLDVNITLFEKTAHIGGRTLTVNVYGSPELPIELGASIFIDVNYILYNSAFTFNLTLSELRESEPGDLTAIWDGEAFVFQTESGSSWWWDAARMWWRYGRSPYKAVKLVKSTIQDFLKLYEPPYFPFRSLTQRAFELELTKKTGITGMELLDQNGINPAFSWEIIQSATRVNYASNLAYIHGLETMVSFSTDAAMSIRGGNWQIFDNMVKRSGAAFYGNTTVAAISLDKKRAASDNEPKYIISTVDPSSAASSPSDFPVAFDNVVIAAPWQFSDITASKGVLGHLIDEIPYTKLHVTLFASPFKLHQDYFGLPPGTKTPSNVYTTLGKGEHAEKGAEGVGRAGFYSISTLRKVVNPRTQNLEYLYKIFSPHAVTSEFLTDILGVHVPKTFVREAADEEDDAASTAVDPISWYHPAWFWSYPQELPRLTFQDPIIGNGLYYTSGIESFISTMETSSLMGKNVARLIADDFAGIQRDNDVIDNFQRDKAQDESVSNEEL